MIVIITGVNGFLGQHLSHFLQNKGINLIATGKGNSRLNNHDFNKIEYISLNNIFAEEVDKLIDNIRP